MKYSPVMLRALDEHDFKTARRLWAQINPNLPQPKNDHEAQIITHHACTQCPGCQFKSRAYSHAWLLERGLPSGLPDKLRPKAQRLYPVIADAIGIACGSTSSLMKPLVPIVQSLSLIHISEPTRLL